MPRNNPNTRRWGGPGSSHEDASEPPPDPMVKDADDPDRYSRHAKVSGGGGETDVHHAHSASRKRDFEANRAQKEKS